MQATSLISSSFPKKTEVRRKMHTLLSRLQIKMPCTSSMRPLCKFVRVKKVQFFSNLYRAAGAKDNGGPGFRVEYTPTYYAAYVHDVNGNNVEAVHFVTKDC